MTVNVVNGVTIEVFDIVLPVGTYNMYYGYYSGTEDYFVASNLRVTVYVPEISSVALSMTGGLITVAALFHRRAIKDRKGRASGTC